MAKVWCLPSPAALGPPLSHRKKKKATNLFFTFLPDSVFSILVASRNTPYFRAVSALCSVPLPDTWNISHRYLEGHITNFHIPRNCHAEVPFHTRRLEELPDISTLVATLPPSIGRVIVFHSLLTKYSNKATFYPSVGGVPSSTRWYTPHHRKNNCAMQLLF